MSADGFLARWSRRKLDAREEPAVPVERPAVDAQSAADVPPAAPEAPASLAPAPRAQPASEVRAAPAAAPPTLDDVAALTADADFSRFVAPGVDDGVKRAALKKLFSDPHFNLMDGLDTYIDDYNKADPLPASMLRKMAQTAALGLLRDDDENPDLQLQPDDAARRPGASARAAGESGPDDAEPA
jgi:hypothetical protein